jgi:hypothetical protein
VPVGTNRRNERRSSTAMFRTLLERSASEV